MLVLQQLFNLSGDELEFQVNDRRSFEESVGLGVMNSIPDATTVAFFRERLRKAGVIEELFEMFEEYLRSQGLQARGGQIIDATLVPVPKQRNTREENKEIKAGRLPEGWDENPDRLQQKDLDARWTQKNGLSYYGYKNSICIDVDHGFIRRYAVTPANIHDSQMLPLLLDPENEHDYVWADSRIHPLRDTDKKDWARKQRGLVGPQDPDLQLSSFSSALCPRSSDCMSHS